MDHRLWPAVSASTTGVSHGVAEERADPGTLVALKGIAGRAAAIYEAKAISRTTTKSGTSEKILR
jgi:hypothetical protein